MDPYRRKFLIGLHHGDDSGHVLVHVNGKIIVIDFNIKEDKQYSFYLGPELFNLNIKQEDQSYKYEMLKDNQSPTPLNLARAKSEKEDMRLMAMGFGFVAIIVLLLFVLSQK